MRRFASSSSKSLWAATRATVLALEHRQSFARPVDVFLSIGTGDGRITNIVSTNKRFLRDIRNFLRTKLDTNNAALQGTINIETATISQMSVETQGGNFVQERDNVVAGARSTVAIGQGVQ